MDKILRVYNSIVLSMILVVLIYVAVNSKWSSVADVFPTAREFYIERGIDISKMPAIWVYSGETRILGNTNAVVTHAALQRDLPLTLNGYLPVVVKGWDVLGDIDVSVNEVDITREIPVSVEEWDVHGAIEVEIKK